MKKQASLRQSYLERAKEIANAIQLSSGLLSSVELEVYRHWPMDFTMWYEGIGVHIETFWELLEAEGLPFARKDALRDIIRRGRFKHVDEAMMFGLSYAAVKQGPWLAKRFTPGELQFIEDLFDAYKQKKIRLLRKTLALGRLSFSASKNYVEGIVFLLKLGLHEQYFTNEEWLRVRKLYDEFNAQRAAAHASCPVPTQVSSSGEAKNLA